MTPWWRPQIIWPSYLQMFLTRRWKSWNEPRSKKIPCNPGNRPMTRFKYTSTCSSGRSRKREAYNLGKIILESQRSFFRVREDWMSMRMRMPDPEAHWVEVETTIVAMTPYLILQRIGKKCVWGGDNISWFHPVGGMVPAGFFHEEGGRGHEVVLQNFVFFCLYVKSFRLKNLLD